MAVLNYKDAVERITRASEIDLARFAAFLDGEGNVNLTFGHTSQNPKRKDVMCISVANTDARLMRWLLDTFGGSIYAQKPVPREGRFSKKVWFTWRLHANKASLLLQHCEKYLIIKQEEARLAVKFQATFCKTGFVIGRKGIPRGLSLIERGERAAIYDEFRRVREMRNAENTSAEIPDASATIQ